MAMGILARHAGRRRRIGARAPVCATRSPKGEANWLPEPKLAYDSPPSPGGLRRGSSCFASEGWWACLDSNQEPDRYERPALTIELQAPPRCRLHGNPRCQDPLTLRPAIRQCRGPFHTRQSIFFEELLHASWPDLFRPPAFLFQKNKDVDHRDKPGDDDPSNGALLHRGA